ncbi:MAG: hypothetical protein J6A37_03560 [Oscillospiraceae bacterium]|nr:hypothetical protein [Oscillospiraceae bacterium]
MNNLLSKDEIEQILLNDKNKLRIIIRNWNNNGIIFAEDTNLTDSFFDANAQIIKEILVENGGNDYKDCTCIGVKTDNGFYYAYFTWEKWDCIADVKNVINDRYS